MIKTLPKMLALMGLVALTSVAHAQEEKSCVDPLIAQTREKIRAHYAKSKTDVRLEWIRTVDFGSGLSNGPAHKEAQYETVWYTTYTVIGALVFAADGQPQVETNYAFYVRMNPKTCEVLKVALLKAGQSPLMQVVPSETGPGKIAPVETSRVGSPQPGFTYAGASEESVPVFNNERVLSYYLERVEQLIAH